MRLDRSGVAAGEAWLAKGYSLPRYAVGAMCSRTVAAPRWLHFGAGNIFRAYQAVLAQDLLAAGLMDTGIIVVEGYDYEIVDKMYRPHDNIGIVCTLCGDGTLRKTVVAAIAGAFCADVARADEWAQLRQFFASPSLQMVSFTITEKGYLLHSAAGTPLPGVEHDLSCGPVAPESYMGKVASLLHERYVAGALPIAMVSMDNCSQNGDRLLSAVSAFAQAWEERDLCQRGFLAYVHDNNKVSFPWTMIDKITPRPDPSVGAVLAADGIEDLTAVVTTKDTYVAPFVNAEACQYLVVEDAFPNGRPPLEEVGVYFTSRETVGKVEKMKVCTCLNPLHTCLALFGCLLGYERISDEMGDAALRRIVERVGYGEGLPVVVDPGILSPRTFLDEVVEQRIPNPFLPDTPQRIACDTSQKLPIRFGETIKAYCQREDLSLGDLRAIPLVFAAWLRYLMAVDDNGVPFTLSPDPLLPSLVPYVADIHLGDNDKERVAQLVTPLLRRADLFGVDLVAVALAPLVLDYFLALIAGVGAVRRVVDSFQ